jgi:hemerythrin-like domain-containing protein
MSKENALPGFDSPGVGFEQPFEMLEACHERVQRSLALLGKLVDHIDQNGHDSQSRSAAADVLRYFDLAAPLHHEDEEVNVFPLLLTQGNAPVRAAVQGLQSEHQRMSALWAIVREPLERWSQSGGSGPVDASTRDHIERFRALYDAHIETEENLVYPSARARMNISELADMGRQMQARRQAS